MIRGGGLRRGKHIPDVKGWGVLLCPEEGFLPTAQKKRGDDGLKGRSKMEPRQYARERKPIEGGHKMSPARRGKKHSLGVQTIEGGGGAQENKE